MTGSFWFFQALGAAVLWGLGYALSEKLLKSGMTPAFMMMFTGMITLPSFFILTCLFGEFKSGFSILWTSGLMWMAVLMALTVIGGNLLIILSIAGKNATLASMVEISYPLFIFLFAWMIFREVQLNWASALGALLIFSGVATIYFKS